MSAMTTLVLSETPDLRFSLKSDIHHLKPPQALKHSLCLTLNTTARLPGSRDLASRQPEALNSAQ